MIITCTSGSREGERISFDLKNPVLIGRSHSVQIRLREADVSGRHAEITKSDSGVHITCHSRHGLRVDGEDVNVEESRTLSVGDEITIGGQVRFRVDNIDEDIEAVWKVDALAAIKHLMSDGETAKADEALKELLAVEPNNLAAKMLYGTCRQLLGDEETFSRIHDELAPLMEGMHENDALMGNMSIWDKYHKMFLEQTTPDGLVKESESVELCTLYGCCDYRVGSMEEIGAIRKMIDGKRRRKRMVWLLLIAVPFLFWFAWWLGQRL